METGFFSSKYNRGLGSVALAMIILALASYAILNFKTAKTAGEYPSSISVNGIGEVTAVPDVGQFYFSVTAEGATADEAQKASGTKINAVFAQNDEMGLGAVKALQAAGMKDKVIVVGIDAITDAMQAVKKGEMDATVFQNSKQQGAGAIEVAIKMAKKQTYDKQIMIPFQLVTKENLGEFLK